MKLFDSLIPYQLMTVHPLMHVSLLTSAAILHFRNGEEFYKVPGNCPEGTEAQNFILGGKESLVKLAVFGHAVSIFCHYIYQLLNHFDVKVLANFFLFAKMLTFFLVTLKIQSSIDFTECKSVTDKSMVMAWLTFEVLAYYLNIISLGVFIFIQNIKKFKSIRDRVGLAGDQRKKLDFLVYSKDDIHWWSVWFTQLCLAILAIVFRTNMNVDIKWSAIEVFAKHLLGAFLVRQLYFNSKFQFKLNTKVALILTVGINILLIYRYKELKAENSIWWAPIVLNDIVLYFVMFIQMLIEYFSWGQKVLKWRQDLMFDQQFRTKEDQSESRIQNNINSIIEEIEFENLDPLEDESKIMAKLPLDSAFDQSIKMNKEMKVNGTMYSAAYFALMKANKKELGMTKTEQYDVIWKTMYIGFIQFFFTYCIAYYSGVKFALHNDTNVQLNLIFATLLVHLVCISGARSGMYMMKYVLCHPEEFVQPQIAFLLGFIQFTTVWIAETINMMKASQQSAPISLVVGAIGFKVIIDIPSMYYGALQSPIKQKVGKLKARKPRKAERDEDEKMTL